MIASNEKPQKEECVMAELHGYHAHIYYGDESRSPIADRVCKDLAARFPVELATTTASPVRILLRRGRSSSRHRCLLKLSPG